MLSADERTPVALALSEGQKHDAPEGRNLLESQGTTDELLERFNKRPNTNISLLADKAYEGDATCELAFELGYGLCIPPKSNRKNSWGYDKELYKRRNEIERLFRRVKEFRRVFTRYDKLDVIFLGFIFFGFIVECLR
jgi:transposase